jgi:hypothetical protein
VQRCSSGSSFVTVDWGLFGRARGRGRGKGKGQGENAGFGTGVGTFLRSSADRLWLVAGREIGLPNHLSRPSVMDPDQWRVVLTLCAATWEWAFMA